MNAWQILGTVIALRVLIYVLKRLVNAWNRMGLIVALLCVFAVQSAMAQEEEPPEEESPPVEVTPWEAEQWQIFGIAFLCGGMLWGRIEKHLKF